ncbi:unnamed protein product [Cochlearia groenlandica]
MVIKKLTHRRFWSWDDTAGESRYLLGNNRRSVRRRRPVFHERRFCEEGRRGKLWVSSYLRGVCSCKGIYLKQLVQHLIVPVLEVDACTRPSHWIRSESGFGQVCNDEQFEQFSSFLSKVIATSKDFSLPSERQKFGLITEASLASSYNIGASGSRAAVLQLAGCSHFSKILKVGDDIQ